MEENRHNVVGIVKGVNKKTNTPYTVLHTVSDFDSYSLSNGSVGCSANNVYIRGNINCKVGDVVQFVYGVGYQGKAIVVDAVIIKEGDN